MKPTRELIIAQNGKILSAQDPRYETYDQYYLKLGIPVGSVTGAVQWADPSTPGGYLTVLGEASDGMTEAEMIIDGVAHAWANRLSHLTNQQILDAITRGVELAMQGRAR